MGMPYYMAYPNKRQNEAPKMRNPIEVTTPYYLECEYVYTELHMTYEEWLEKTSEAEKMNFRTFIRLHRAKEIYKHLPEKERFMFGS